MEKKKILFIIPYLLGGGALKTVSNLSKEFSKKNDVTVIGIFGSNKKFDYSGRLIELNTKHQHNPIKRLFEYISIWKRIKDIKQKGNFDYSISFLVQADIFNVLTKTKNNEKTIVSIRNIESIEYKNNLHRMLEVKFSAKRADYIVAISKEVEDDMRKNFGIPQNKIKTIYNPCVLNYKSGVVNKEFFSPGKTVITLGGLKQQKGQWHLIRAFSKVVEQIPDARLLIFGKGPLETYLKELISGLGLGKNVSMMGYVVGPYDYVKQSNIFVFSSLYEGLGNAMMEALKCKIPIISTDYSSGAREILAPNTDYHHKTDKIDYAEYGILIPNFDGKKYNANDPITKEEEKMSRAIVRLLTDKKMNMHYKKQSAIRAKDFDIENISTVWYELLKEIEANHEQ